MPKFHTVHEKIWQKKYFLTQFFRVTRIAHMQNFDTTTVRLRTVDGESLSEITIHNFEKSKTEILVLPYGRKK